MMVYSMKFNIANKLDIEDLNHKIDCYSNIYHSDLYIFMSPKTLENVPKLEYRERDKDSFDECAGLIGVYQGYKVFSDPTMEYGDVEFR